jgi:hypothetical protein
MVAAAVPLELSAYPDASVKATFLSDGVLDHSLLDGLCTAILEKRHDSWVGEDARRRRREGVPARGKSAPASLSCFAASPNHSTFSKNRHGRFQESKLFEQLFEQIVRQCVEVGLVQGKHLSVDGSFVEANAHIFASELVANDCIRGCVIDDVCPVSQRG